MQSEGSLAALHLTCGAVRRFVLERRSESADELWRIQNIGEGEEDAGHGISIVMTCRKPSPRRQGRFVKLLGRMAAVAVGAVLIHQAPVSHAAPLTDKALTIKECGACHFPYSPRFLPAFSWKKIIDNLDDHFGEDASLDEKTRKRILAYMVGNRSAEIPVRITKTAWFTRVHTGRILAYSKDNSIRMSNCGKCHR